MKGKKQEQTSATKISKKRVRIKHTHQTNKIINKTDGNRRKERESESAGKEHANQLTIPLK